jgi:hypothetical protein
VLHGGGWSTGGDRREGGGRRLLAAGCWGGKAFGVRAVLGVVQTWPEEDRSGLASLRLLAAVAHVEALAAARAEGSHQLSAGGEVDGAG